MAANNTETTTKTTRFFDQLPFSVLDDYRKKLDMLPPDFMKAIGYVSFNSYQKWEANGFAPKAAVMAAECLVRRQDANLPVTTAAPHPPANDYNVTLFIASVPEEMEPAFKKLCIGLEVSLTEINLGAVK